jgi:hypothetical protein
MGHSHVNGDRHHGRRRAEGYSARPHPEPVVLEIGDELGALIVHTAPELHGVEIEISPAGEDGRRAHKEVLERTIDGRSAYTAVFDRLARGEYTLWIDGAPRDRGVAVSGGEISEIDWTTRAPRTRTTASEQGDRTKE